MKWEAPTLLVTPLHLYGVRSEFYACFAKVCYVPVCRYPTKVELLDGEDGAILKLNKNGIPYKVLRRVVVTGRRKRRVR